jgi:hypothetical protein
VLRSLLDFSRRVAGRNAVRPAYDQDVSALPAEPPPSPLDPVRILDSLPESDRDAFLAAYREAHAAAADPEGFSALLRILRLWRGHALMAARPGYREAREAALAGTGRWVPLDEAVRQIRASR